MAKKKVMVDVISDVVWPFCWIGKRHLEGAMQQTLGPTIVMWTPGARRFVWFKRSHAIHSARYSNC
jgi:hypothetical protein